LLAGHPGDQLYGSASFFEYDGGAWVPGPIFTLNSLYADFGVAVALDGDRAMISSVTLFDFFPLGGRIAEVNRVADVWTSAGSFEAVDGVIGDGFGKSLALTGTQLVVGASGDDDVDAGSGAAWFLELDSLSPWVDEGFASPGPEFIPELVGWGLLSGGHDVALKLFHAENGHSALLALGVDTLFAPFMGGTLVPDPLIVAGPFLVDNHGQVLIESTWPRAVPSAFVVHAQWWMQEPFPPGWYASNGLALVVP
jgi:hypothetical protein